MRYGSTMAAEFFFSDSRKVRECVLDLAMSNFADEAELNDHTGRFRKPTPLPMAAFRATRAFSHIFFSGVALSSVTN
jgi:hypothetical protein